MDSILVLGEDPKITHLLTRLGYATTNYKVEAGPLPEFTRSQVFDIVLLNLGLDDGGAELCEFLRRSEGTRDVPIIVVASTQGQIHEIDENRLDKVECIQGPFSAGILASKVATQLRLRKIAGADEERGSIAEVNATLRELNERFKRELDEARAIQQGLLPEVLPANSRFDVAVSYQPLEQVGGDWYFMQDLASGKTAVQIADVTGHGLSAAFIGSMTKLALSAANRESPDQLLTEMNRLMAPQIPAGRFVTMFSALYDSMTGEISYARAGHPPALLLKRKEGRVIQLKGDGFAIGFFADSEYSLGRDSLDIGDVLLMYTDGISEAQNRSMKTYGLDRLSTALINTPAEMASGDIAGVILDDFDQFREQRIINDDITLIVMRRSG